MSKPTGTSGERRFWATSLVILCTLGLATCFYPVQGFWSSYTLDIVGPAWNYILIRGLFAKDQPAFLSKLFTPRLALVSIISVCFLVETAQYFGLYEAHFDPFDYLAYLSLLLPCYVIDKWLLHRRAGQA